MFLQLNDSHLVLIFFLRASRPSLLWKHQSTAGCRSRFKLFVVETFRLQKADGQTDTKTNSCRWPAACSLRPLTPTQWIMQTVTDGVFSLHLRERWFDRMFTEEDKIKKRSERAGLYLRGRNLNLKETNYRFLTVLFPVKCWVSCRQQRLVTTDWLVWCRNTCVHVNRQNCRC